MRNTLSSLVVAAAVCLNATPAAEAQTSTFTTLYSFASGNDGRQPNRLLLASDGIIYGITRSGGPNNLGLIFKINTNGTGYQAIFNFTDSFLHGSGAYGGLVEGQDGKLYGSTRFGGAAQEGTVFRVDKTGLNFQRLHSFTNGLNNGGFHPEGTVLLASDGKLYGTCRDSSQTNTSPGSIWRINTDGSGFQALHYFGSIPFDGDDPQEGLCEGPDGKLYGTTWEGGISGEGIIFSINKDGTGYTKVRDLGSGSDGANASSQLLLASDGRLYGTTYFGGVDGRGTVFRFTPGSSDYSVIYSFDFDAPDGQSSSSSLGESQNGVLFGSCYLGGSNGLGTVFAINKSGSNYRVVKHFKDSADGSDLLSAPIPGPGGFLYGAAEAGGDNNNGKLFRLNQTDAGFDGSATGSGGTSAGNTASGNTSAGNSSAGNTSAGGSGSGQTGGSGGATSGLALINWDIVVKRPKDGKTVKFRKGKSGIGTVIGAVETDLEKGNDEVEVEVALVLSPTQAVVDWDKPDRTGKVNKKGVVKFKGRKFGASADLGEGQKFELWVRASTNFTQASTEVKKVELETK